MKKKTTYYIIMVTTSLVFFSYAMDCSKQCKNVEKYKDCLIACLQKNNNSIKLTENEARKEWFSRYPCPPFEESNCYYPYKGDYVERIKRDTEERSKRKKA